MESTKTIASFTDKQSEELYETLLHYLAIIEGFTRRSRFAGLRTVAFIPVSEWEKGALVLIERMAQSISREELSWYDSWEHALEPLSQEQMKSLLDRSKYLHQQCVSFSEERAVKTGCEYMHRVLSQGN